MFHFVFLSASTRVNNSCSAAARTASLEVAQIAAREAARTASLEVAQIAARAAAQVASRVSARAAYQAAVFKFSSPVFRNSTTTGGACTDDTDDVIIGFNIDPVANAGGVVGNECDLDFILGAVPSVGTGAWTMDSGPGGGSITGFSTNANDPTATVSVNIYGTYVFRWTEVNVVCSDFDLITVNFYEDPVADAGGPVVEECVASPTSQ